MRRQARPITVGVAFVVATSASLHAQNPATLRVRAVHESAPVQGAIVRAGTVTGQTNATGEAILRLAAGTHTVVVARLGYSPDTTAITLAAGQDTSIVVRLEAQAAEVEGIVIASTRTERRVEDTPLRVEVVDEEEVAEKTAMTPGDIAMMLNETSGLRVQTTSPSLGGASVRVQGLRGRYTLLLADGLPLYGGQAGGLGLLQIPPVDLARAEIIKGAASALYGSSALGGVVNLVSRRPGDEPVREILLNQTSRGGSDAVVYLGQRLGADSSAWAGTMLVSGHRQRESDLDSDGWADMPGYDRIVVRPRLFFDRNGRAIFATAGFTGENRDGGTLDNRVAPDGSPYGEGLRTRRADVGVSSRLLVRQRDIVAIRASAVEQHHRHEFGPSFESDRHRTWFAEASLAMPRAPFTYVMGAAFQAERYRNTELPDFDYDFRVPSLFAQADVDAATWVALSVSARLDAHSAYATTVSPRISALLRPPSSGALADWSSRVSIGGGTFAPVPFTEETEVVGLGALLPLRGLQTERAVGGSIDINGPIESSAGRLELNATLFGSRLTHPVAARDALTNVPRLELINAPEPTRSWGAEFLARLLHGPARVTATYAYVRGTEWNPDVGVEQNVRRDATLVPRHTAGLVASLESEEKYRLGVEAYYTGRQALDDNPFRDESRPYVIFGLLGERWVETRAGVARLFINFENLGDVRQTRYDPLVRPTRGKGGRWTTDAWTELSGFTVNGGVRFSLGRR